MNLSGFIHQKSYEQIAYKIRAHPLALAPTAIGFLFLLCAPIALYWLLNQINSEFFNSPVPYAVGILLLTVYLLSIALFGYTHFVSYYLNLLVITNDRLLHIEHHGLFSRTISEVDLYRIQDATSEVKGIFPSLLHYGNLIIQTAGAREKFLISNIPHPEWLRQAILTLAEQDRRYHAQPDKVNN